MRGDSLDRRAIRPLVMPPLALAAALGSGTAVATCGERALVGELVAIEDRVDIVDPAGERPPRSVIGTEDATERSVCAGDELRVGSNGRAVLRLPAPNVSVRLAADAVVAFGELPPETAFEPIAVTGERATDEPVPGGRSVGSTADGERDAGAPTRPARRAGEVADEARRSVGQIALEYCRSTFERAWFSVRSGYLRLFTNEPQRLNVTTPHLNASVEGTEFSIGVDAGATRVQTTEGTVTVCNARGHESVGAGEIARSRGGSEPEIVDPDDAVQWALHYPPLDGIEGGPDAEREALAELRAGRVDEALSRLDGADAAFAPALRAIVAVTRNETALAATRAEEAVTADPRSPTARLARSYVRQARFDLDGALADVETAATLDARRPDVLARLAELQLANGRQGQARRTAETAAARFPTNARLQSVLGFVRLGDYALDTARAAFDRAARLDRSDPSPWLGLALVDVRRGRLDKARRRLEIAVNLDPGRSLLRSYLGRVYGSLGRVEQALAQLALAESLDGLDPTPRLFRALLLQRTGQPVAALADLDRAAAGVDARAVYRSRSALDEDFSTALTARARVHDELGFGELTLLDGAEALQRDPGSYAGHRLLADALLARSRRDRARASAALQAQLRQPLTDNPLQLRLGSNDLGTFGDLGPFAASLNEYGRLFGREGTETRIALAGGPRDTRTGELRFSALGQRGSLAATGYHFRSDGYRTNGDEQLSLVSALAQYRVNVALGVQLAHSLSDLDAGDDYVGYDRGLSSPYRDRESGTRTRIGLRHRSDGRELLAHLEHAHLRDRSGIPSIGTLSDQVANAVILDVQQLLEREHDHLLLGLAASDERLLVRRSEFGSNGAISRRHFGLYGYAFRSSTIAGTELDLVAGLSVERADDERGDEAAGSTQSEGEPVYNPKLGLSVRRGPTRLRLAGFRTLQRTLSASRTLEPVQIQGFTQQYDGDTGARGTTVAVGLDSRAANGFSATGRSVHYGAQWIRRDVDYATRRCESPSTRDDDAALFVYVPTDTVSIAVELGRHRRHGRDCSPDTRSVALDATDRFEIELSRTWSNGVSLRLRPRHFAQRARTRERDPEANGERVSSRFWIADAALDWRPRHRAGPASESRLSLSIGNLFDRRFEFQDRDPLDSTLDGERTVRLTVELSFR